MRVLTAALFLLAILSGTVSADEPITARTSPDRLILQIRLIHGDKAAQAYLGPGAPALHGREFGPAMHLALIKGEIKPHPGQYPFEVELRDFDFALMRGAGIRLGRLEQGRLMMKEQSIPQEFGTPDQWGRIRHAFSVDVFNGVGWIEVLLSWVGDRGFLVVRAPEKLPLLRPKLPHRALITCSRELVAANHCGTFPDMKLSELANLVRHAQPRVANMLFVTDETDEKRK